MFNTTNERPVPPKRSGPAEGRSQGPSGSLPGRAIFSCSAAFGLSSWTWALSSVLMRGNSSIMKSKKTRSRGVGLMCGTTLRWHVELLLGQVFAGGAFDDATQFEVAGEMYTNQALPWSRIGMSWPARGLPTICSEKPRPQRRNRCGGSPNGDLATCCGAAITATAYSFSRNLHFAWAPRPKALPLN